MVNQGASVVPTGVAAELKKKKKSKLDFNCLALAVH